MTRPATPLSACRDGIARVRAAPALLAGVYAVLLLITAPGAWLVHGAMADHLGASTTAEAVARGGQLEWLREFGAQATGLASDVSTSTAGGAAVLRNFSDAVELAARAPATPASRASGLLAIGWWLVGTFLSGGIIDRYARMRPLHARGFFGACGGSCFRLLRLNAGVVVLYALGGRHVRLAREPGFRVGHARPRVRAGGVCLGPGPERSRPAVVRGGDDRGRLRPRAHGRRGSSQRRVRVGGRRPLCGAHGAHAGRTLSAAGRAAAWRSRAPTRSWSPGPAVRCRGRASVSWPAASTYWAGCF